jgi:hypothetical protein
MGKRGDVGPRAPAGRLCAPFVLASSRPACVASGLAAHKARRREPGVASQTMVTRQSTPQRITATAKISVNGSS